jgi:hypothetical protein
MWVVFIHACGPNKRELDFFNLLFPEALVIEIATQTNEYAQKQFEAAPNKNWYPTPYLFKHWPYMGQFVMTRCSSRWISGSVGNMKIFHQIFISKTNEERDKSMGVC